MSPLKRLEKTAFWVAGLSAGLGFLTSAGCSPLAPTPSGWAAWLHPALVAIGLVAGLLAVARTHEIEMERWRIVEDGDLTKMERDWAHRAAERRRRWAGTAFVAAPLMIGYWLAYQLEGEGRRLLTQLLPVSGLVGAILGYLIGRVRQRGAEPQSPEP